MNKIQKSTSSPFLDKLKKPKPVLTIWHKLLFLSPILIIILIIKGNEWYSEYQLSYHGIETIATIKIVSSVGVRDPWEIDNVAFEYTVGDSIYTGYTVAETNNNYVRADNGLPITAGDKYMVRFVKNNPDIYKLNYYKPDTSTIITYLKLAATIIDKYKFCHNVKKNCCFEISRKIFKAYGYDGLAKILFHNELMVENFEHNSKTFETLMESKKVKDMIEKCKE